MVFPQGTASVISEKTCQSGTVIRVLELASLRGSDDPRIAQDLFFAQQAGMTAKIVEIELKDSSCTLEPGALYFMKGKLRLKAGTGRSGIVGGLFRKMLSGETMFLNEISGTGTVYLEPTFRHVVLHEIKTEKDALIVDKGAFYAATNSIKTSASMLRSVSGQLFGGEGIFQTRIEGLGVAIIFSPVPESELVRVKLDTDTLQVDGNFALMRSATVDLTVEKSATSWVGSALSGEGLFNVYRGPGSVWLAPTQGIYERMANGNFTPVASTGKSQNTNTQTRIS